MIQQKSIDSFTLKNFVFSLPGNTYARIDSLLSKEEQLTLIELMHQIDRHTYHSLSLLSQTEYEKFLQQPNYLDGLIQQHIPLSTEQEQFFRSVVQQQRKALLESDEYVSHLYSALCQHMNLKSSQVTLFDYIPQLDLNLEYLTLYSDFLTVHHECFPNRQIEKIKYSLEESIYCSRSPILLEKALAALTDDPDSFLLIPVTECCSSGQLHTTSYLIEKKKSHLKLTLIDKAMLLHKEILQTAPVITLRHDTPLEEQTATQKSFNPKIAIPYIFEVENNQYNRTKLTYLFSLGTTFLGRGIQFNLSMLQQKFSLIQWELKKMAACSYWGKELYTGQIYTNNCYIKAVDGGLQHVLGQPLETTHYFLDDQPALLKKIPQHSATSLTTSLAIIVNYRLEKLAYAREAAQAIEHLLKYYLQKKTKPLSNYQRYLDKKKNVAQYVAHRVPFYSKEKEIKIDSSLLLKSSEITDGIQLFGEKEIMQVKTAIDTLVAQGSCFSSYEKKTLADIKTTKTNTRLDSIQKTEPALEI